MELNIVLFAPEIPGNTGSIGRLSVNLNTRLHLIKPLGFKIDDATVRRAGLDYWQYVQLTVHEDWDAFLASETPTNLYFLSTKGKKLYTDLSFANGDFLVFGQESKGLPPDFYERYREQLFTIPMPGENARSLNLSNAAAVVVYEAYRQLSQ